MNYLVVCLLAIGIGFVDVAVKGFFSWIDLPSYVQGWSWHISLFLLYLIFLWLIGFIRQYTFVQYFAGILLWINEDVTFYVVKSIFTWHFYWNDWFFPSLQIYVIAILLLNIIAYLLFKKGDQ